MKNILAFLLCASLISAAVPVNDKAAQPQEITAKAYAVIEAKTERIIESRDGDLPLPIASTTKIMSALIALEQPDSDAEFTADAAAIKVEGTSMGLREGDTVTLRALAAGMLLPSGNDGANAAAVRICGSVAAFADKMNARAEEIGMTNTHFVTPSGLHDENHYSTALDMAKLAAEALKNPDFKAICSQPSISVKYGNPPYSRRLTNHNRLVTDYDGCVGVKTGFTKKAGRCLVSAAERGGVTLICVTLNDPNDWRDHAALLDRGFNSVKAVEIPIDCDGVTADVVGSDKDKISVAVSSKAYAPITEGMNLDSEIHMQPFFYAPIKKGDYIGEIRHIYNGEIIAVTQLSAAEDAEYTKLPQKRRFTILRKQLF